MRIVFVLRPPQHYLGVDSLVSCEGRSLDSSVLLTGAPVSKERQLPERKEEEGHRKEGWDEDEWEVRWIREGEWMGGYTTTTIS